MKSKARESELAGFLFASAKTSDRVIASFLWRGRDYYKLILDAEESQVVAGSFDSGGFDICRFFERCGW